MPAIFYKIECFNTLSTPRSGQSTEIILLLSPSYQQTDHYWHTTQCSGMFLYPALSLQLLSVSGSSKSEYPSLLDARTNLFYQLLKLTISTRRSLSISKVNSTSSLSNAHNFWHNLTVPAYNLSLTTTNHTNVTGRSLSFYHL